MNRYEFFYKLDAALSGFGAAERKEILGYYEELIQDARDSGETEEAFIDRLGSVETIVRTIRRDGSFVQNVKAKKDFQLRKVFDVTVRLLAYGIFAAIAIAVGSTSFAFAVTGISLVFTAVVAYFRDSVADPSTATLVMYAGGTLIGAGLLLAGIWGFKWIVTSAKSLIEKILEAIDKMKTKMGERK